MNMDLHHLRKKTGKLHPHVTWPWYIQLPKCSLQFHEGFPHDFKAESGVKILPEDPFWLANNKALLPAWS